jgi:hypothetical protein
MALATTGKLHTIFETKQVTDRFQKREFIVEISDNPKYPQVVLFQLTGNRCDQMDRLNVGDEVRIEFSLRGREWKSPGGELKYFNSLDVWSVEAIQPSRPKLEDRPGRSDRNARNDRGDDEPPPCDDESQYGSDDLPF